MNINIIIIGTAMFASIFLIIFGAVTNQGAYVTSGIGVLSFCLGKIFNTDTLKRLIKQIRQPWW